MGLFDNQLRARLLLAPAHYYWKHFKYFNANMAAFFEIIGEGLLFCIPLYHARRNERYSWSDRRGISTYGN